MRNSSSTHHASVTSPRKRRQTPVREHDLRLHDLESSHQAGPATSAPAPEPGCVRAPPDDLHVGRADPSTRSHVVDEWPGLHGTVKRCSTRPRGGACRLSRTGVWGRAGSAGGRAAKPSMGRAPAGHEHEALEGPAWLGSLRVASDLSESEDGSGELGAGTAWLVIPEPAAPRSGSPPRGRSPPSQLRSVAWAICSVRGRHHEDHWRPPHLHPRSGPRAFAPVVRERSWLRVRGAATVEGPDCNLARPACFRKGGDDACRRHVHHVAATARRDCAG